jgi:pimeloyl-ACP methyl ester carboxylesterase
MRKKIYTGLLLALISFPAFSQIDTSRIEFLENPLLRDIHQIIIDHHSIEHLELGDPSWPIQPVEDLPPQEPCTLLRNVFFIHGLGGSNESWQKASMALQYPASQGVGYHARYCHAHRMAYTGTYFDLRAPADDLITEINTVKVPGTNYGHPSLGYNPDPDKNFIIAHSQGGVIARTMLDLNYELGSRSGYGGLVTVASSLQGAMILNNKSCLEHFISQACHELARGPIQEIVPVTGIPWLNIILEGFGRKVENFICTGVGVIIPQVLSELNSPMAMDFAVGAQFMNDLNDNAYLDAQSATPVNRDMYKVAFYGVEPTENLIWRTFNWMVQSPNSVDPWEANDDFWLLEEQVKPLLLHYTTKSIENNNKANAIKTKLLASKKKKKSDAVKADAYRKKALAWQRGIVWINTANNSWLAIIGAMTEVPMGEACFCYCQLNVPGIWKPIERHTTVDCADCHAECIYPWTLLSADPVTIMIPTIKESDGVVLAESAQDMPYATNSPVRLEGVEELGQLPTGSSHMQIRNDRALRDNLTLLLDGAYGNFFELQKR